MTTNATRPPVDPAQQVDEVVQKLNEMLVPLEQNKDPRRFFHSAYRDMSASIRDAIRGGVFDDPAWIARWDVLFARRYMEAMDGWSQKQPVSDPWRLAFTAAESEELEPAKHALLAMNAHINYDLPQAILEVVTDAEFEQGTLPPDRHADNYRLQDVLFSNVAKEGAEFEQAQGGGTLLARVETPFEHPATKKFMGGARDEAWANAARLAVARARGEQTDLAKLLAQLEDLCSMKVQELTTSKQVVFELWLKGFGVLLPDATLPGAAPDILVGMPDLEDTSPLWTGAFLDEMRTHCDPLADAVVDQLFHDGGVPKVNELVRTLLRDDQPAPETLPGVVRDYLEQTARFPAWLDRTQIRRGEELFGLYSPQIVTALFFGALPACYAAKKGVQVLHLTGRLGGSGFQRRIVETAQMIVDVMTEGGLGPGGDGVRDAQKVRLMHAAVRHLVRASGEWNPEWDEPINQEDLAGTLTTFHYVTLAALDRLGVPLTDEQREAYVHAWNVVGWIMGIDERLIPTGYAQAQQLSELIFERQYGSCPEGVEMTAALVEFVQDILPGTVFDGYPATMIRYLVGDDTAGLLGVAPRSWEKHMIGPAARVLPAFYNVVDRLPLVDKLVGGVSLKLVEAVIWVKRGGERAPFAIPTSEPQPAKALTAARAGRT